MNLAPVDRGLNTKDAMEIFNPLTLTITVIVIMFLVYLLFRVKPKDTWSKGRCNKIIVIPLGPWSFKYLMDNYIKLEIPLIYLKSIDILIIDDEGTHYRFDAIGYTYIRPNFIILKIYKDVDVEKFKRLDINRGTISIIYKDE